MSVTCVVVEQNWIFSKMPFCLLSCVVGSQITNFKKRCFSNCEHCKDTYQYLPQAIAQQTVSMATTSFRAPQQTVSMATTSSRAPTLKSNVRRVKVPRLKANQLKVIQYLLSAASYVTMSEKPNSWRKMSRMGCFVTRQNWKFEISVLYFVICRHYNPWLRNTRQNTKISVFCILYFVDH